MYEVKVYANLRQFPSSLEAAAGTGPCSVAKHR